MSIDDIKKRFTNEIKLRAYDDKYIDKGEEREILQIAIQLGVSIDSARPALFQVCNENDFVVESVIVWIGPRRFWKFPPPPPPCGAAGGSGFGSPAFGACCVFFHAS